MPEDQVFAAQCICSQLGCVDPCQAGPLKKCCILQATSSSLCQGTQPVKSCLQSGQVHLDMSQGSMHCTWYRCRQGRMRTGSPSSKFSKQIAHSRGGAASVPSPSETGSVRCRVVTVCRSSHTAATPLKGWDAKLTATVARAKSWEK
mmetsp:Transcript_29649/g.44332  ORF Transcript_29649/g.44332 Transcript_29649/m.44332 type:complete len:147 (-) Transcript_29649:33-473(-)